MNLLFSMSLAGSLVFLAYLAIRPLTVRYFSSAWRYRFLKVVLVFYLLPYQYLKYRYYEIFYNIFFHTQYQSPASSSGFGIYDMDRLILVDEAGNRSIKNEKVLVILLAVWGLGVASFAIYQAVKYISCKRELLRIVFIPDSNFYEILDQCRECVRIKKKVGLFCCSRINIPFTIGLFFPRIILPDTMKEEESVRMAVSHELIHVKNHDIFIKFMALLVMLLHWYNPLTYVLYWEICRVYEYVCDEKVTQNLTGEEKEKYGLLIVELAQKPSQTDTIFANAFSNNYKMIKERIILMNRLIISPKHMRIASFALAVLLLVISPLPVMAYSPMVEGKWNVPSNGDCNFNSEISYATLQNVYDFYGICDPFLELGTEYDIFIDDSGIPILIYELADQTERSICNHIWKDGYINTHTRRNDGGCIVNIYFGQKCSQCNEYILENLYNSLQYLKCPH